MQHQYKLSPKEKEHAEWLKQRDDFLNNIAKRQQTILIEVKNYCEACRKTKSELEEKGGKLNLHEIIYSPLEYVTLCSKCHSLLHMFILNRKMQNNQKIVTRLYFLTFLSIKLICTNYHSILW